MLEADERKLAAVLKVLQDRRDLETGGVNRAADADDLPGMILFERFEKTAQGKLGGG
jgi:hypothetical protein